MSHGRKLDAGPDAEPAVTLAVASAAELQTCVRDLMSLIALPALTTSEPLDILRHFGDAIGTLLPIRFCVITAQDFGNDAPSAIVWLPGASAAAPPDAKWQAFAERCMTVQGSQLQVADEPTPSGALRVVKLAMAFGQDTGTLVVGADGASFPSLTEAAVLRAAASLAAGRLKAARLVHEREEANRVKDEFLAMLGHELRNPLAPIVTALDLMRLRGDDKTAREQNIIRRQLGHLIRLVDDLMDVARIRRGKVDLRNETVEVATVLSNAVEMASLLLEQRGHRLTVRAPASGLRWTGDPMRLAQVVANLLTNAARYTEPGGDIRVEARRDGGEVVISVCDTGIGMTPELMARVFDIFYQGQRTLERAGGGLGLGLVLVKSLVQMHGGGVEAHSPGLGLGSEFTVRLPIPIEDPDTDASPQAGATTAAAATHRARPLRILLVDDNVDGADAMGGMLEAYGHVVKVIYSPVLALQACAEFAPQIAVLDIGMPVMDGYELALRLREQAAMRTVPLVALTGYGSERDTRRSRQAGFGEHLVKPVDPLVLLALIDRLVEDESVPAQQR